MSAPELQAYKEALQKENNMMELRRVSWSSPDLNTASKVLALKEICSRAEREGRKVLLSLPYSNLGVGFLPWGSKKIGLKKDELKGFHYGIKGCLG
jgi:hypothetical protein